MIGLAIFVIEPSFAAEVATQKLPKSHYEVSMGSQLLRMILGLSLVVAIIVGIGWLTRRYTSLRTGPGSAIEIKSGVSVGPKERVLLVEVGEEQILIGVAPGNVTKLHVLANKVSPRSVPAVSDGDQFFARLKKAIKEKNAL